MNNLINNESDTIYKQQKCQENNKTLQDPRKLI